MYPNPTLSLLPPTPSTPKSQFRALLLCGYGADLFPLIEQSQGQVKALLPVGGRRMIDWILGAAEAGGVLDILVLAPEGISGPVGHHLRSRRAAASASGSSSTSARVELEEVPEEVARRGTVGVLRWALGNGWVKTDFIILPCDLLLAPIGGVGNGIGLASLIDRHRVDDSLLTSLFYERGASGVVDASKEGPSEVLTIFSLPTNTLLDLIPLDKFPSTLTEIPLRTSLFTHHPSPTLTTSLLPTQIYIFSSSLLSLFSSPVHKRRLDQIEELIELVGWVSRMGWRKGGKEAVTYRPPSSISPEDGIALGRSTTQPPLLGRRSIPESVPQTGANTPAVGGRGNPWDEGGGVGGGRKAGMGGVKIVVWRKEDGWCGRGNSVQGFVEMNRAAIKLVPPSPIATNTPPGVFISDSFLHPSVYAGLGEKVGLKRCVIGRGCTVGKGSKLIGVVLMEDVVVGENVKMENCVISNGARIGDKASLKDCELGRNVVVDPDSQLKNEKLVEEEED